MSIEREILRRINESRRIDESLPPELSYLASYDKEAVIKTLKKAGIDIENTSYNEVKIKSSNDLRARGSNSLVLFKMDTNSRMNSVGVWYKGKYLVDAYSDKLGNYISKLDWYEKESATTSIVALEFNK